METKHTQIVVLGAGPGGYAAAFYAADLGMDVTLIEKDANLGGVCLNRGCIPSKALLHATNVMSEAAHAKDWGITFTKPKVDTDKLRTWKQSIIDKLAGGVKSLAKARKVTVINGRGHFENNTTLRVETEKGQQFLTFDKAIIAVGSRPALPSAFDLGNPRIMTSTEALEIEDIPKKFLVIGGGYIGMELGTVYAKLGSSVDVVEAMDDILMGADRDLVRPVKKFAKENFNQVLTGTKVAKVATAKKQIKVTMEKDGKASNTLYDRVLVSVGRTPNSANLGLENANIDVDEKGFIKVDNQQKTSQANIYAIGDIAGGLLLAHKASKEARIAVEVIAGHNRKFEDIIIPAVVFTDPEIAWCGLTESEAKEQGISVKVGKFPWGASGRALTLDNQNGLTKLIIEPDTNRILGVGVTGPHAGDLIAEGILAVEMGATVEDLAETVHPHPTLSETLMESAEAYLGHATHIATPKRK